MEIGSAFNIDILGLQIPGTTILAAIAAGVAVLLIILILLCCCCCCRRNDKKKRTSYSIPAQYHPAAAKGNQYGVRAQQRQLQYYPSKLVEHHVHPNHIPPTAASPMQKQPSRSLAQLPSQSSTGNTNSISPLQRSSTPQFPSAYLSSENSNVSKSESSMPAASSSFSYGSSQTVFDYNELATATNGFSEANLLGEGGFGLVHKGVLPNGKEVAVKSLRANSGQGETEFEAEVEIISRVDHRHLVTLVGYCITGSHRLLVYEFVPNKTLEFHLYGKGQPTLDWPTRLKIALGSAKGLAYLHEDCHPRIIHRDIKAANILLDSNFQAKVADFGLAKLTAGADTHVSTRVVGTLGYLAPEYASSGRLTDKSDVYSFGVMLLELITGRRPVDRTQKQNNLVDWAKPLLLTAMDDENFNYLVDPRLQFSYKHSEMARMVVCAANCVRKTARRRPLMSQVVHALEGNMSLDNLNEGIAPGLSLVQRYDSASEHSDSHYRSGSKGHTSDSGHSGSRYKQVVSTGFDSKTMGPSSKEYASSEYDGTTSEYELHASSSSDEGQTTKELDNEEVQRNRRHWQNRV